MHRWARAPSALHAADARAIGRGRVLPAHEPLGSACWPGESGRLGHTAALQSFRPCAIVGCIRRSFQGGTI